MNCDNVSFGDDDDGDDGGDGHDDDDDSDDAGESDGDHTRMIMLYLNLSQVQPKLMALFEI